jgi:hypothetical protein
MYTDQQWREALIIPTICKEITKFKLVFSHARYNVSAVKCLQLHNPNIRGYLSLFLFNYLFLFSPPVGRIVQRAPQSVTDWQ